MKKLFCTVASFVLLVQQCRTDILLAWDATGDSSPATYTAETILAGVDTGGALNTLTRTGLSSPGTANSYSSNGWNLTDTFNQSDDFVSFTVQAATGLGLTLTSLDYKINGSSTGPNNGRWGYSTDGGGSFVFQSDFTISSSLSLASWDFADFTSSGPVEFRFWSYGATGIGGGASASAGSIRVPGNTAGDDLILNGLVVPEPGSLALLGLGALGLLIFGRRRRA